VQAEDEGDHLSENELYSMVVLLIVAGHETTVSLIANAVLGLLSNPDQLDALHADPSLMPSAVEELLRYDSPVERTITRWVAADLELGGTALARGDLVVAVVGSANRDADQFPDPATLDFRRQAAVKHVAWTGLHHCSERHSHARPRSRSRRCSSLPNLRLAIVEEDLY
jgi:cytochrome P450